MLMRTGDKTELMHYLIKRVPECIIRTTPSNEVQFIIDGVRCFTSDAVVVFDGYDGGASTKDETHRRRAGNDIGTSVFRIYAPDNEQEGFSC